MNHNLVIEIGTEELPSSYMVKLEKDLSDAFEQFLSSHFLSFSKCQVFLTPRRIVFWVSEVAPNQEIPEKVIKGPPLKIALTEEGKETSALTGFLEKCQTTKYWTEGPYIYANVKGQNEETVSFFQKEFSPWLLSFPFEKKMRWESWQFVRPVRWILALYSQQLIDISLCGISSGKITRALRGYDPVQIDSADDYLTKIAATGIILSSMERRKYIERVIPDQVSQDILLENVNRTEQPIVCEASFAQELLVLPTEVVCTVISNQLKCFPAWKNGSLLAKFFFVMNGSRNTGLVTKGYEKVITARLNDASYFFQRDLDLPLRDRIPDLVKMTFMEKLGTLADKTHRLLGLTKSDPFFTKMDDLGELISFSKTDLATTMVQELTELQGTMGKIYASKQGIKESIACGIEDHYHPRSEGDFLPHTPLGTTLSVLDRIDTIAGAHAIGMNISSSSDPLGLRRIANGLVRILISENIPIRLQKTFEMSLKTYQEVNQFTFDQTLTMQNLLTFFLSRLRSILSISYRYDIVNAVTKEEWENPNILDKRCKTIAGEMENPAFKILVDSYTRIKNITKDVLEEQTTLVNSVFQKEEEIDLLNTINQIPDIQATDDSKIALSEFYKLNHPITRFFDKIMVMDEDRKVRNNRLALLYVVLKKVNQFADFSRIVFEGGEK